MYLFSVEVSRTTSFTIIAASEDDLDDALDSEDADEYLAGEWAEFNTYNKRPADPATFEKAEYAVLDGKVVDLADALPALLRQAEEDAEAARARAEWEAHPQLEFA